MLIVIIFGVWVLSFFVANLKIHIDLNEEETLAFRNINSYTSSGYNDYIHSGIKYLAYKFDLLNHNRCKLYQHLPQFIFHQENVKKDIKTKYNIEPLENKITRMIAKEESFSELIKLSFIYKNSKINRKVNGKLMDIMEGCQDLLQVTNNAMEISYGMNNLAKCLVNFKTVGQLENVNEIENKKLFSLWSLQKRFKRKKSSLKIKRRKHWKRMGIQVLGIEKIIFLENFASF